MAQRADAVLEVSKLGTLIELLIRRGYEVVGPRIRDGAIVTEPIQSADNLPLGWGDEQRPGHYRLKRLESVACFGFALGPQSWKKYLHPPEVKLWSADRSAQTFRILNNDSEAKSSYAFFGVRACELAAIAIQDRVLRDGDYRDSIYEQRRDGVFIVAVQCTRASETCFCESLGTGPRIRTGFDLLLTEIGQPGANRLVVKTGSERGAEILAELPITEATEDDLRAAEAGVESAAQQQVRHLDVSEVGDLLDQEFDHPRWEQIAERCLSCGNCTMVCPTCFCTTVEDTTDVTGNHAERWRRWDSCLSMSFSYIHGGSIRSSGKARFRQFMTHKLAWWFEQFGTLGCVGCGRCITWCPVGIDITEEIHAMKEARTHGNA